MFLCIFIRVCQVSLQVFYKISCKVAEILQKEKADPNAHDNKGWTSLMFASQNSHIQLVKLLLMKKANPNAHNNEGCTALMLVSGLHIVELLLNANADPNARSNTGLTPLLLASNGVNPVAI